MVWLGDMMKESFVYLLVRLDTNELLGLENYTCFEPGYGLLPEHY